MQEMTHQYTKELRIFHNEHHDNCSNCGYEFKESDTTHLGYVTNRRCAYLCNNCSDLLVETVGRYVFAKRDYQIPPSEAKLWRYMDFSKYVYLLSKRALFFSSTSKLEDVFEGAKGIVSRKELWDKFYYSFFVSVIKNPPKGYDCDKTPEEIEQEASRLLEQMNSIGIMDRESVFVNCWHENLIESEAMWKLYSKDITNAICIQTTYQSLYYALDRNPDISIGRVNYIDFSKRFAPFNGSYWYKRKSFEHEKEVRAVIHSRETKAENGIVVPADINLLIENIYISPSAPKWFADVVSDINKKYKIKTPLVQSTLIDTPFY